MHAQQDRAGRVPPPEPPRLPVPRGPEPTLVTSAAHREASARGVRASFLVTLLRALSAWHT